MASDFVPKKPVQLDPPKFDPISTEDLKKASGANGSKCYVAIKGKVYDVTGNKSYEPGGSYHAFAGSDASRALAKMSTDADDVSPEWKDLPEKEINVLNDWVKYFSNRYNVVGTVEGATNMEA